MTWIQTHTGKRFDVRNPRPESVDIRDIAHSLAMQVRFNGHCSRSYSVAEHSVNIADWILEQTGDRKAAYAGLLHDASEAYLCDIPKPIKPLLTEYHELEEQIMIVIAGALGFEYPLPSIVKEADGRITLDERKALFDSVQDLRRWSENEPLGIAIVGVDWQTAKARFLERFEALNPQGLRAGRVA
ncbi:MAG: phosphohydrolase [Candidatus Woesearchaeota archaeon]